MSRDFFRLFQKLDSSAFQVTDLVISRAYIIITYIYIPYIIIYCESIRFTLLSICRRVTWPGIPYDSACGTCTCVMYIQYLFTEKSKCYAAQTVGTIPSLH